MRDERWDFWLVECAVECCRCAGGGELGGDQGLGIWELAARGLGLEASLCGVDF
jgi:hypothetical protein